LKGDKSASAKKLSVPEAEGSPPAKWGARTPVRFFFTEALIEWSAKFTYRGAGFPEIEPATLQRL
jgi:hypothetical protein